MAIDKAAARARQMRRAGATSGTDAELVTQTLDSFIERVKSRPHVLSEVDAMKVALSEIAAMRRGAGDATSAGAA